MNKNFAVIAILCLTVFLLNGCSQHVRKVSSPITTTTRKYDVKKNYKIGKIQTAYIGNPIVKIKVIDKKQRVTKIKAMLGSDNFIMTGGHVTITGSKNTHYDIVGDTTIDDVVYTILKVPHGFGSLGVLVRPNGSVYHKVYNRGLLMAFSFKVSPAILKFTISEKEEIINLDQTAGGELNSELIYCGTDGKSIKITYREYTGKNMARSAFSQHLVYEKGKEQIRFKDYIIKVHESTNEKIIYTVVSDGLPAIDNPLN